MAGTVYASFAETVRRFHARTALMHKKGGVYTSISYAQLAQAVDEVAAGLADRGVRPGDGVAIYSYNRPEWVVTDLAVAKLGAILVPVYHTLPEDAVRYILKDAEVGHIVVETPELFSVVAHVLSDVEPLKDVITLFEKETETRSGKESFSFESLRRSGAAALAADPSLGQAHESGPDELLTIVYTSGTTGEPKGAMLTHRNILSNVFAAVHRFSLTENDVMVSFLPLCHMFERTCGHYTMLLVGGTIAYAESVQTVAQDVQTIRPTLMIVVPRVLEKVYNTVEERVLTGPYLNRVLMISTLRTYGRYARLKAAGQPVPLPLGFMHWLLGRLVVKKLLRLGGGRLRLLVSGGAPLDRRLGRVIRNLGFSLLEGYGLTETSPVVAAMAPEDQSVGTVGKPLEGVEVRIGPNDEVLVRGPNVMIGYFHKPEETAKAIDSEGWFHTGDQGRFDERGNLVITGRIKELVITSYGKNIAPVPIEQALAGSKYIEQAVVFGDRKPFLTALIVPGKLTLEAFARESGIKYDNLSQLLDHPEVRRLYEAQVKERLAGFAHHEQVRAFRLVSEPFAVENGLLTPSLKMRRPQIYSVYRDEIEKLYEEH
jgi:long-chain acyl-CoA synthetase